MRAKVEYLAEALYDLAKFSPADRRSHFAERDWVAERPVSRSRLLRDPALSGYALRYFEFGAGVAKIAIFEYDPAIHRIRILQCRPARPRRGPRRAVE